MKLSLILPCYNPPQGWDRHIHAAYDHLCKSLLVDVQLIVVLDGDTGVVREEHLEYLRKQMSAIEIIRYSENRGKGYAIRKGVEKAEGDIIIYTDIDFPYTQQSVHKIYTALAQEGYDVAIGIKDNDYYTHVPAVRRLISRALRGMVRFFLSMPVTDTQCGLKGFKSHVKPVFLSTTIDRYLFDLEFVRNCYRSKNYNITAIPVTLNERVQFRQMNYRILLPEMLNFVLLLFKRQNG